MGIVPALLHLRVPRNVERGALEAVLVRAIGSAVPTSPELTAIPDLTEQRRAGPSPTRVLTYALVLRAAPLQAPTTIEDLVRAAAHAADDAVRAEFGDFAGAAASPARTAEQLAVCRRAVVGSPHRQHL
jgi:hypothetical protein